MIRYAHIINDSIVDGLGIRVCVFLQGCKWFCEGCHNPHLFPLEEGIEVTERKLAKEILKRITPMHSGITFSGGDPMLQAEALFEVIEYIKSRMPEINIWIYTGYLFDDIKNFPVIKLVDVLVDGQFILGEKDISLKFKGSSNQRVIDVKKSLENGQVTLYKI